MDQPIKLRLYLDGQTLNLQQIYPEDIKDIPEHRRPEYAMALAGISTYLSIVLENMRGEMIDTRLIQKLQHLTYRAMQRYSTMSGVEIVIDGDLDTTPRHVCSNCGERCPW